MKKNNKKSGFFDDNKTIKHCSHPEHNPPSHLYISVGKKYRHICPACDKETVLKPMQISF